MTAKASPIEAKRRPLPPFAETLAGVAPPLRSAAFDATIGREELAVTLGAASPATSLAGLPTVSIDFSEHAPATVESGPDLRVVSALGEGGMGVVSLAEQRSLDRHVAVKTTRRDASASTDAALCEEARVTGRLEHPNVVPVHAFGRTADGRPVMVMKRIEGVAWRMLLHEPNHPAWEDITTGDRLVDHLQILIQVANALAFAHSKGVVHRDVKPENVMVGYFGEVLLVDFGLAVRTDRQAALGEARVVGTPAYMAPEMVAGWPVDERTDVYLLGATLHEILLGRPPHDGESLAEVLARAYESVPPTFSSEVPTELADLCRRALARHPDDRVADARAFRADLQEYLTHRASHALVQRGEERLLDAGRAATPAARRSALTEARFACRQAIEQWSGNEAAKRVERDATLAAIELELDERNPVGARSLLHGLESTPAALEARVVALEAKLDDERRGAERLRAIEHDMDSTLDASGRRNAVMALAVVATVITIYVARRSRDSAMGSLEAVKIGVLMLSIMSVGLGVFWRRLASNAFGRKLALASWSTSAMMLVHRVIGHLAHEDVPSILTADSVIFTGMIVVLGIALDVRLLLGAPLTLIGAFGSALAPAHAPQWFSGSTTALLLGAAGYFWVLQKKRES